MTGHCPLGEDGENTWKKNVQKTTILNKGEKLKQKKEWKKEYSLLLGNLQGSDPCSEFPNLAPQPLWIAKEVHKDSPLKSNFLWMMLHNLDDNVQIHDQKKEKCANQVLVSITLIVSDSL